MKTFKLILKRKCTVWIINKKEIQANTLEEAKKKAQEMYLDNSLIEEFLYEDDEIIEETLNEIDTFKHEGEDTHQLFVEGEIVNIDIPEEDTSDYDYDDDPAFDHLRDEERNFIAQEREKENDY